MISIFLEKTQERNAVSEPVLVRFPDSMLKICNNGKQKLQNRGKIRTISKKNTVILKFFQKKLKFAIAFF